MDIIYRNRQEAIERIVNHPALTDRDKALLLSKIHLKEED